MDLWNTLSAAFRYIFWIVTRALLARKTDTRNALVDLEADVSSRAVVDHQAQAPSEDYSLPIYCTPLQPHQPHMPFTPRTTDSFVTKTLGQAYSEHKEPGDAVLHQRLSFIEGLQYTKNNDFRFPLCLSTTTVPTPSSPRTPTSSPRLQTPSTTPSTPTSPTLPLSPFSTTSHSSSESYFTSESYFDLPTTPSNEDIPIHLISFPSWRHDSERAKIVFGSLAQVSNLNLDLSPDKIGIEAKWEAGSERTIFTMGLFGSESDLKDICDEW